MTIGGRNSQVPIGRKHSMPFNRPAQVVAPDVGNSTVGAGAFLAELRASWGEPDWFLAGTSMEKRGEIPARFSSSDYLIIYGNIAQHAATPDFFIDYALAGVPLFKGGIDLGMQTAPDLRSAFELVDRYSSPRLPFLRHAKVEYGGRVGIELVANGDLGPGRSIICEVPLLVFARLAGRYLVDRRMKRLSSCGTAQRGIATDIAMLPAAKFDTRRSVMRSPCQRNCAVGKA